MVLAHRAVGALRDAAQQPLMIYRWWQLSYHRRGPIRLLRGRRVSTLYRVEYTQSCQKVQSKPGKP